MSICLPRGLMHMIDEWILILNVDDDAFVSFLSRPICTIQRLRYVCTQKKIDNENDIMNDLTLNRGMNSDIHHDSNILILY